MPARRACLLSECVPTDLLTALHGGTAGESLRCMDRALRSVSVCKDQRTGGRDASA
jgi:hypothetical protein